MSDADPPDPPPVWHSLPAQRRHRVLLALAVLTIAVRVALPAIVRRVVINQADAALVGRLEIDDVDLALLTGGFTLHGLRVFANDAAPGVDEAAASPTTAMTASAFDAPPPTAGEGPAGSAPVFSAARLTVDLGFLAFLRRTVEVQRFELEGIAVSLDRARDGTLVLPVAVPTVAPVTTDAGPGWGVLIQSVMLRDGRVGFRDFAVGDPPQHIEVALPTIDAGHLALLITERGVEPGKVTLDAGLQDGTLHLEATLESLAGGPAYESHVVLANVPIADGRLYIPKVGWSDLAGRLDADLVHRFESQGAHTLHGTIGLRELAVRVRDLEDPALAWSALGIDIAGIDLVAQHADITTITLTGARVVTRPAGPEPLPVLHGLFQAAADGEAVAAASASVDAEKGRPWTWTIGKVLVQDAQVHAIGGDGSLDIGVSADVAQLASVPNTHTTVRVTLAPSSGGTVALAGDLTLEPLGFDGTLVGTGLALPALTQPIATAATRLLKNGVASFDLAIAAGVTPQAPPDGVRVAGTIGLADLDVVGDDPKLFALRWKDLAVALGAVTVPGVLASGAGTTPGPIEVALTNLSLTRPEIVITRAAQGIALPPPLAGGLPPPAEAPGASAVPSPRAVQVQVDHVAIHQLRLEVNDTAVQPFYRAALDPIDFDANDLHWPGPAAKNLKLNATGLDGAVFKLTGTLAPEGSRLVARLTGLPLAPFNPYAASTGYGVGGGTAELESSIKLGPGSYDTTNRLMLHGLDVRAGEGDALFTSQFGMPLTLALALMTDLQGDIVLDLPIAGDAKGTRTGIGTLVGKALARAILNAVTSPLKLIGAVASIGDKPASLAPPPIVFLAGRDTLADGEAQKLAQLASLLGAAPGLRLHLRGEAGDEDRRWLREQALGATLAQEGGVAGTLRHIGERGVRSAVLTALTARAEGQAGEIPPQHQSWFEAQVAAQIVSDSTLQELAAARATAIQQHLASDQGVAIARVLLDDPVATVAAAPPVVTIGLGSATSRPAAPVAAPLAAPAVAP